MHHSQATVATKRAPVGKSRSGRPLSDHGVMELSLFDALDSADEAIKKKKLALQAAVDEVNALIRFRRQLRALSDVVAA